MSRPLVSVIIASYNVAEFLPISLKALTRQTLKDIEIICVDDASTDDSLKILKEFEKKDKRVKVIANKKKTYLSPSAARNIGLKKAAAPYVMFCDADDYYEPEMCQKMYEAISKHDADLAVSEINVIYRAHREMKVSDDHYYTLKYSGMKTVTGDVVMNTDFAPVNKIFKKELINEYNLEFPENLKYEDAYFCSAYFCVSKKVYYINERLYNYVRHAGSIMSQTWSDDKNTDYAIDHLEIAFKLYDFLAQYGLLNKYPQLYWRIFESFLRFALVNSKSRERVKQVRAMAKDFIAKHADYFAEAGIGTREAIQKFCSAGPHINIVQLKRFLIRLMPTYRLEVANIHSLQALRNRSQQVYQEITEYLSNL